MSPYMLRGSDVKKQKFVMVALVQLAGPLNDDCLDVMVMRYLAKLAGKGIKTTTLHLTICISRLHLQAELYHKTVPTAIDYVFHGTPRIESVTLLYSRR